MQLLKDGNNICALIGTDLVQGIGGCGTTVHEALRDLALQLEANGVTIEVNDATPEA